MSFLRLLLPLFKAILSSSSLKEYSESAITRMGVRTPKFLSDSPSASERLIKGAPRLFSSSKWNLSISSSNERQDEAISSLRNAAASGRFCGSSCVVGGRFCGIGKMTRGRSLPAKNPSLETSIRANLELPTFIAWPTSWKM